MRLVDAVYARTEELLKEKCITMYKLCIEGGIPYSTLATMRNSKTVTLATVYGICQGFKISLNECFDLTLFDEENLGD